MASSQEYDVHGRGFCMVFANFVGMKTDSAHLKGYRFDLKKLRQFFEEELDFKFKLMKNSTKKKFLEYLLKLPEIVQKKYYKSVYIFVLSHGCENGLQMCRGGTDGREKETDESGQPVCVPVNEILNQLIVSGLDGIPKCLFIQACFGNKYMPLEDDASGPTLQWRDEPESNNCGTTKKGADIFVAYSSQKNAKSFVYDDGGSEFISITVKCMRDGYQMKDIVQIMSNVKHKMSERTHNDFVPCNNSDYIIKVCPTDPDENYDPYYYPCTVIGKPKGSDEEERPVLVQSTSGGNLSYVGFVSHRNIEIDLDIHHLSGWVYLKPEKIKYCKLEIDELLDFAKNKNEYLVEGQVRCRNSFKVLSKGTIFVKNKDILFAEGYIIHITPSEKKKNLDLSVVVQEDPLTLTQHPVDNIEGHKAKLYIDGELHGFGNFETNRDNVCGINATVHQVPWIQTTLTKRLHLVPPIAKAADCVELEADIEQNVKHPEGHQNPQTKPSVPLEFEEVEQALNPI